MGYRHHQYDGAQAAHWRVISRRSVAIEHAAPDAAASVGAAFRPPSTAHGKLWRSMHAKAALPNKPVFRSADETSGG
jgi:hypothetical protein